MSLGPVLVYLAVNGVKWKKKMESTQDCLSPTAPARVFVLEEYWEPRHRTGTSCCNNVSCTILFLYLYISRAVELLYKMPNSKSCQYLIVLYTCGRLWAHMTSFPNLSISCGFVYMGPIIGFSPTEYIYSLSELTSSSLARNISLRIFLRVLFLTI